MTPDSAAPEPLPQTEGYLIVLRPERAFAEYVAEMDRISPDPTALDAWWRELLQTLRTRPERYAGWDRAPVGPTMRWNVRFLSAHLVSDLDVAREVLGVTPAGQYELVHLRRVEEGSRGGSIQPTASTLGFEVGTWGGPFSLISDTMLYPRWHPADDGALPDLRVHAARLNASQLFPGFAEAADFRRWYRTQEWSEIEGEPGDFCIARIDRVAM